MDVRKYREHDVLMFFVKTILHEEIEVVGISFLVKK